MEFNVFKGGRKEGFSRDFSKGKSFQYSNWDAHSTYVNDQFSQDFVTYQGALYVCLVTNTNIKPDTNENFWALAVDKIAGERGPRGAQMNIDKKPDDGTAMIGDSSLNIETGEISQYTEEGTWESKGKIKATEMAWDEF